MKRIYNQKLIEQMTEQYGINNYFTDTSIPKIIIQYEKGEFLSSPDSSHYIQLLIKGTVGIYGIREDGTSYYLAQSSELYLLGEMELFDLDNPDVYAESLEETTCIAISIDEHKDRLLNDNTFTRKVAQDLAKKLSMITTMDVTPTSLSSRVYNYMKYRCPNHIFTGIEKTAFHLHCSPRQLQRVMNDMEKEQKVKKIGKGKYQLR